MPERSASAERLVLALSRSFRRRRETRLIVLGGCIDDSQLLSTGNTWVSGEIEQRDYPTVTLTYGVDSLLLPYRTSLFGFLKEVADETGLSKAYFDWSQGRLPTDEGDLALVHGSADCNVLDHLSRWCG